MLEKILEDCIPWEEPHTGAEKNVSPTTKEERAEEICDELFMIPHSPSPCTTVGEKVENWD